MNARLPKQEVGLRGLAYPRPRA